jgi:hypothetical protein
LMTISYNLDISLRSSGTSEGWVPKYVNKC